MQWRLRTFLGSDSGATAVEYALLSSIIVLLIVAVITNLGVRLSGEFSEVRSTFK